ncbi:MAG: alpha-L-fucosidase [Tenacibaculum sp.]
MKHLAKISIVLTLFYNLLIHSQGQQNYQPSPENIKARQWFQDAKFGLFVHWGVYSILGDGEWVMNNQNIHVDAYKKLPTFFNPIYFNAEEWVQMVKDAGMKYITVTSRHHDGFSMFNTQASNYNIVDSTPYGKDVLKQLSDACEKEDIKLFFYYSLLDWSRDDYYPRGRTGTGIPGRGKGEWYNYIKFMKTQLTELLTNYGDIAGIWFDGHWDQKEWDGKKFGKLRVNWHYDQIYKLVHKLQPQCLIGNNHHIAPIEGEDFQMFEKDLPGKNTTGFGTSESDVGQLPFEVCETINGSWGFNLQDRKHKSKKELVQYIVKAAGYGSNLLLNVGPMPNGKIQDEHKKSLKQIGNWMRKNGETIYGTRAGFISPTDEYATTQKGKKVFLHILQSSNVVFVKGFNQPIKQIKYYNTQQRVTHELNDYGLLLKIPKSQQDPIDTIIEITLR